MVRFFLKKGYYRHWRDATAVEQPAAQAPSTCAGPRAASPALPQPAPAPNQPTADSPQPTVPAQRRPRFFAEAAPPRANSSSTWWRRTRASVSRLQYASRSRRSWARSAGLILSGWSNSASNWTCAVGGLMRDECSGRLPVCEPRKVGSARTSRTVERSGHRVQPVRGSARSPCDFGRWRGPLGS